MSPSVSTAKELLARLVAFDTTSHKTNIPLIDFVEAYLALAELDDGQLSKLSDLGRRLRHDTRQRACA
jgi:hypothetical protein